MSIEEFKKILKEELDDLAIALNTRIDNISDRLDKLEFEFETFKRRWVDEVLKLANVTANWIYSLFNDPRYSDFLSQHSRLEEL